MHPTLAAFAASYRHRYPDLAITEVGGELRLEWQEAPTSPCYAVTLYAADGAVCIEYAGGAVSVDGDVLACVLAVMARERGLTMLHGVPVFAAPGTFGALILEHVMTRGLPVRPMSPDRLN